MKSYIEEQCDSYENGLISKDEFVENIEKANSYDKEVNRKLFYKTLSALGHVSTLENYNVHEHHIETLYNCISEMSQYLEKERKTNEIVAYK